MGFGLTNETVFSEQGSAFTTTAPDNVIDVPMLATPVNTLKKGENTFAYILGLTDTSNSLFSLVADGFAVSASWTYVTNKAAHGGIWEGKKAVVGLVDGSAAVQKVQASSLTVMGNPVTPTASYFSNTATAGNGQAWLSSPQNNSVVGSPIPPRVAASKSRLPAAAPSEPGGPCVQATRYSCVRPPVPDCAGGFCGIYMLSRPEPARE